MLKRLSPNNLTQRRGERRGEEYRNQLLIIMQFYTYDNATGKFILNVSILFDDPYIWIMVEIENRVTLLKLLPNENEGIESGAAEAGEQGH